MTDIYGTEPPEHEQGHDEVLTHEQDMVREPPSDYEFADDHEGAAATEEHADEQVSPVPDSGPAPRSPLLLAAAGGGILLLLGGIAWWQFGGSSSSASLPTATMSTPPIPPLSSTPPAAPMAPLVTRPTPDQVEAASVAPRTASALAGSSPDASLSGSMPANPSMGSIPATPTLTANAAPTQPAAPPSVAPPSVAPSSAAEDERITALTSRIDDLQKSLDQATQQLSQVTNMVAASASGPKDVQDRLDKIDQQLEQLHHPAPALSAPVSLPAEAPVGVSTTSTPHAHHAIHVAHKAKTTHIVRAGKPAEPNWVLRAASPGQAWVADSATSHDLKALHVGDSLPGLGRVLAIQQQGGNWVVQGTGGTVR